MADIHCPVCGKSNPDDLATCRFCQAPLKTSAFTPEPGGSELPDWLRDLQSSEPTLPVEPDSTQEPGGLGSDLFGDSSDSDLPEWLRKAPPVESTPQGTPTEPQGATPARLETAVPEEEIELPDWLVALGGKPLLETLPTKESQRLEAAIAPTQLSGSETAEEGTLDGSPQTGPEKLAQPSTPEPSQEWLATFGEGEKPGQMETQSPVDPSESSEIPDWLARLKKLPAEKTASSVPAFTIDKEEKAPTSRSNSEGRLPTILPNRVSQMSPEPRKAPAAELEPELAHGEMPGWLEAMRSGGAPAPTAPLEDLSGAEVIAAGPLIGLRGVLPADTDAIQMHKPVAYTVKLRVTDDQQARLVLLEELLATEQKPKPLPAQPMITPQYIFRLAIGLVLLLPVLVMVISQSSIVPIPQAESMPSVMNFYDQLSRLAPGAPVLLAVDYEAGFTGEMELAARIVTSQLVKKNANLAIMSTNTAGPALAERFLGEMEVSPGKPYSNYANLGYLPGGALGLAELVHSLRQSLPYSLDSSNPWATSSLVAVRSLTDFDLVIVITNDAETARAWIEQVTPTLQEGGVPLLLVASAQAEPLVRPYTEGTQPQVQAFLAGLPGSVVLEKLILENQTSYSGTGREIWDAFSLSLTITVLVILIGSLNGAIIAVIKENKPDPKSRQQSELKIERKQEQP
jgi:hypothetical protein